MSTSKINQDNFGLIFSGFITKPNSYMSRLLPSLHQILEVIIKGHQNPETISNKLFIN